MSAVRVVGLLGIVLVSVVPAQAAQHRGGHGSARIARGSIHAGAGSIHTRAPRTVARAPRISQRSAVAYPRGYYGSPGPSLLSPLTGVATLATGLARPLLTLAALPHSLVAGAIVGTITAGASYAMAAPLSGPYGSTAPIPYRAAGWYPVPAYAPAPYVVGRVYAGVPHMYVDPRFAVPLTR